ncbi:Hypothetical predicted protein [Mytilus galloprovincialis]|uniref:PDZ domain-containing protein n=1 Tax=Mytilus galloprovincialis TaxID=29158 RepID=A0A8B6E1H4_MYTGA|nr:Hypothetical predicted protein [Mytilus galloprovincialis]
MLVALCLASFIIGVVVTILIQTFVIRRRLLAIPVEPISHKPQFCQYKLPKELLAVIRDQDQKGHKESCIALNLVIQFLFKELRDTNRVRRWVTKKMNIEFNDMLQSTTGKLIEKITLRDFNLGPTFPVINCVAVDTVKLSEDESLEELDIMADLDYTGGFQLAIEIDLVFKKWAYLSVTVTKLKGIGRLQFTRNPYTHWSFTFYEDPVVEFEVESKFGGRPVPQVTSLIISQIKRILRKRHTLPHYKMRYKPFFIPPDESYNPKDISLKGNLIGEGQLEVKVINCSSLLVEQAERYLFCTLSVDKLRWLEYEELRKKVWVVYEVKIIKGPAQSIGLTFKDDFMLEKYEDVVVVDNVTPNSPASATDIRKGDVLVSVGMTRITSVKQAGKILRNVNDSVMLRLERAKTGSSEDYIKVQDSESSKIKDPAVKDDYINIVIKPCDSDDKQRETENSLSSNQITRDRRSLSTPSSPHRKVLSLVTTGKEYLRRRVKSHTVSEGSVSMTTTSQSELNIPKSPTGHRISKSMDSRQLTRSINGQEEEEDDQPSELPIVTQSGDFIKNRTNSDPGFVLLNSDDSASEDEEEDQDPTSKEQEVKSLPPDGVSIKSEDVEKLGLADMKKTKEVKAQQNPDWNEDFVFYTNSEDKYLNVCVWCRVPPKLDKHEKVIKPGRETLIGHISLPLADISLDCLLTIQRDSQRCVNLVPPENIAGVRRSSKLEHNCITGNYKDNEMLFSIGLLFFSSKIAFGSEIKVCTGSAWFRDILNNEPITDFNQSQLIFSVRACEQARLLFYERNVRPSYELVIGSAQNTKSRIRICAFEECSKICPDNTDDNCQTFDHTDADTTENILFTINEDLLCTKSSYSTQIFTGTTKTSGSNSEDRTIDLSSENFTESLTYSSTTYGKITTGNGTTDDLLKTTTLQTTKNQPSNSINHYNCECPCSKVNNQNLSDDELLEFLTENLEELQQALQIDPKSTKAAQAKKICAPDDRNSSQIMGWLGGIVIGIGVGFLVLSDITRFVHYLAK